MYDSKFKSRYKYGVFPIIYRNINSNSFVLDVGCGTANFGKILKREKNCKVFGIDIDREALKIAGSKIDKTFCVDIDKDYYENFRNIEKFLKECKFDYIIMADVYEHLKYGKEFIKFIKDFLKRDGQLIMSIPNFLHISIRKRIILGKFYYENRGILDKTHVRFFSKEIFLKEMENMKFKLKKIDFYGKIFERKNFWYKIAKFLVGGKNNLLCIEDRFGNWFPDLFAYQIISFWEK